MQNVIYAVFFTVYGSAIQVTVPKGTGVTALFYRDKMLTKHKSCFQKRRPKNGFNIVKLLCDNAHSNKAAIVTKFLEDDITTLPHPPYFLDLAPCDYFLFPQIQKKMLAGKHIYGVLLWDQLCSSL